MNIFGDVLFDSGSDGESNGGINYQQIFKIIKRASIKPRYRISVLNPNETVSYTIPSEDIPEDGIQYSGDYQNGQRRSITLKLINKNGKYTPSIYGIWLFTKFRFDIGIQYNNDILWFPRGIYVMGDISLTNGNSNREISIQLKDKFAIFEGKMGTLEEAYEIELGTNIIEAINGIRNFSMGNGYVFDYKPLIVDPSFIGLKTQSTIRVEEGGNYGQIISELATQLSSEYYYNNVGNLCFYPINETIDDSNKPVIWTFEKLNRNLQEISINYHNEEVINVVKVVGDNIDNGVYAAIVENNNPKSPICIQQIGRRSAPKYTEANIWSNDLAQDLANYYLRQNSFLSVDFTCNVGFNPILAVNNIIEVENENLGLEREKFLITAISFSSVDGNMQLTLCNTSDLPFTLGGARIE